MIPQIIMLLFVVIGLVGGALRHGEPKKGNHDFRNDIIAIAIGQAMLIWGGFYEVFL